MNQQTYINMLQDVIQIQSENGNEEAVAKYYQDVLNDHGIDSKLITYSEGRSSLVAEIANGKGKVLVLSGHMDVVSSGDKDQWTHPPFSGDIEDGIIWGRGASDMKSGLTALVIAFIKLKESGRFKGTIRLLATVGEEIGELGSTQLTSLGYLDDVDAVLIGEPCNLGVVYAHKGSLNYKVVSKGIAAHSSTPDLGENAIDYLLTAMTMISERIAQQAEQVENPVLGKTFHNITLLSGGSQVNSIPDRAMFEANARTIPEYDNEAVMATVEAVLEELNQIKCVDLEAVITANQPPVETTPDSQLVQTILQVANRHASLKPQFLIQQMNDVLGKDMLSEDMASSVFDSVQPMVVSGTTDAAQFVRANAHLEVAVYGPGMPTLNHKIDERLPLSQYLDFIEVYQEVIHEYLQ
ncbi:TPA: ArgE/DapE family deacylase [Streptococcus suis]|uniref:Probable succinyl-diaminopimelate desuccinylase n=1 Tax=Streptococcus canis TaxID=1329 RepID=A0A3P5Y1Z2_STRCB|nr:MULTISPECIES: ArgE/DapE family deacylase [Streptococcus]MCK3952075.1 ArgE/DapE family deacylase [Streptococcus suis]MCK4056240.1 ArgE/DapE family deacylase [Streptococcus suis]VDC43580.1 putative succinyl-diaminopimelate desuccinylase [Streptococcus canis]VTT02110.1 ArcT [Streptococcus dysgalactiae]HEL2560691.1 ArgE/DapE family deacylase [Streptococcus suis]